MDASGAYRPPTPVHPQIIIPVDLSSSRIETDARENASIQEDSSDTIHQPGSSDDSSAQNAQDADEESSGTIETQKKPTWKKHRRLQSSRRRRVSDNPILELPRRQYQQIVGLTAQQLVEPRSQPPPTELEAVLRQKGVEPSQWRTVVEHCGELFHRGGVALSVGVPLAKKPVRTGKELSSLVDSCIGINDPDPSVTCCRT